MKGKHKCFYCGAPAKSIDHVVPRKYGGENCKSNRRYCCLRCNDIKGSSLIFNNQDVYELAGVEKPQFVISAQAMIKKLQEMNSFKKYYSELSDSNKLYLENTILDAFLYYGDNRKN